MRFKYETMEPFMKKNYVKRLIFGVVITFACLPLNAMSGTSRGGGELVFTPYVSLADQQEKGARKNGNSSVKATQTHEKKAKKRIPCDIGGCAKNDQNRAYFDSESLLKSHKALVHFICPYCPNVDAFDSYEDLISQHYPEMNHDRDYCKYCRRYVYVKPDGSSRLARHQNRCPNNPDKPTTCFAHYNSSVFGESYEGKINFVHYDFSGDKKEDKQNKRDVPRVIGHNKFGRTSVSEQQKGNHGYYLEEYGNLDFPKRDSSQSMCSSVVMYLAPKTQMCDVTVDTGVSSGPLTPGEFGFEYKCYNCLRIFEHEAQAQAHDCR